MSTLDWIIVALMIGAVLLGFRRGFVRQIVRLAGFLVAYLVAYHYFRDVTPLLNEWLPFPDFSQNVYLTLLESTVPLQEMFYSALAFGLLFFGTKLLFNVAGHFVDGIASLPVLSFFNRWLGAVLCLAEALLIIIIAINIAAFLPGDTVKQSVDNSRIAQYMLKQSPLLSKQLQELWNHSTGQPGTGPGNTVPKVPDGQPGLPPDGQPDQPVEQMEIPQGRQV